ncbi:DNASE1 [Acrasis kona]|uniref:DNASE1 n=1 Tax=Acrasis kona TaxID=1008807 RepID=A0AAW2ZPD9_9EUKA
MSKPNVVQILTKILSKYHIIFIQEIRDHTDTAIEQLIKSIQKQQSVKFDYVISERLGRTLSKEQYAYVYDPTRVTIVSSHQFSDTMNWFERPPFSIVLGSKTNHTKQLFLTGLHAKPTDAVAEIDHLVDVYDSYKKLIINTAYKNWIVMGDLNAGGSYVTREGMKHIRLRQQTSRFTWLIPDETRTTVADHNHAYDRFVSTNQVVGSADVFRYDLSMKITIEEARQVSDHFPIEMVVNDF